METKKLSVAALSVLLLALGACSSQNPVAPEASLAGIETQGTIIRLKTYAMWNFESGLQGWHPHPYLHTGIRNLTTAYDPAFGSQVMRYNLNMDTGLDWGIYHDVSGITAWQNLRTLSFAVKVEGDYAYPLLLYACFITTTGDYVHIGQVPVTVNNPKAAYTFFIPQLPGPLATLELYFTTSEPHFPSFQPLVKIDNIALVGVDAR